MSSQLLLLLLLLLLPPPPSMPPDVPQAAGGSRRCPGAQIVMAAAAAAFALFASTLQPADVPAQCMPTAADTMELRYKAGLLLRSAIAQAAAALVITPPSKLKRSLTAFVNLLGLLTLAHLIGVVSRVLSATGGSCFTGGFRTAEFIFHNILADVFLYAVPLIWIFGEWEGFA